MKYLKILGLAAVAAMALMAFAGAGSASATVLCKTTPKENDCPSAWDYPAATTISGDATGSVLIEETNGVSVTTCTNGSMEGSTSNTGSGTETVKGKFKTIILSGCNATVTLISLGEFEIHANDEHDGIVTSKGTEITISSSLLSSCSFSTGTGALFGTFKSGAESTLTVNSVFTKTAGPITCPATVRWTSTYNVTSPKSLYFATTSI